MPGVAVSSRNPRIFFSKKSRIFRIEPRTFFNAVTGGEGAGLTPLDILTGWIRKDV